MSFKITVEFCMMWNYAPKAASFAEHLFNHFRSEISSINLIPGSKGAFEVTVNGEKIYSKLETGEFPNFDRIIEELENEKK